MSDALELEFQATVNCVTQMLGTELRSSRRGELVLNHVPSPLLLYSQWTMVSIRKAKAVSTRHLSKAVTYFTCSNTQPDVPPHTTSRRPQGSIVKSPPNCKLSLHAHPSLGARVSISSCSLTVLHGGFPSTFLSLVHANREIAVCSTLYSAEAFQRERNQRLGGRMVEKIKLGAGARQWTLSVNTVPSALGLSCPFQLQGLLCS